MAVTLGRVGLDPNLPLQSPQTINRGGDRLVLAGSFSVGNNPSLGRVLADQLTGYGPHNTDEPYVAFTYDAPQVNGALDGFYWVEKVEVDYRKLAGGLFEWKAELAAVPGRQSPRLELLCSGGLRPNSHSITTSNTLAGVGVPGDPDDFIGSAFLANTRPTSDGGDVVWYADGSESYFDDVANFRVAPDDAYTGACRIQRATGAFNYYIDLVGRTLPDDVDWRLSNGVIRVAPGDNQGELDFQFWTGAAWSTAKGFTFTTNGSTHTTAISGFTGAAAVLINTPEMVGLRVELPTPAQAAAYVDLFLRRGSVMVEGYLLYGASGLDLGVVRSSNEAATDLVGGIVATSDDGDGLQYIITSPHSVTSETTKGGISRSTATEFSFGIGYQSGVGGELTAQSLEYTYHAPVDVTQRPVAQ